MEEKEYNINYPDDIDEFTYELMVGIVGENHMMFDEEIKQRNSKK